ncbi:MAG: hypothetical protein JO362_11970 [Streptomycetaceae bacterium]|nr:hypothetical protein [Streptomycetaceae bacterium]
MLQREIEDIVASMPIPHPFDLDVLIANIAEARGRRIVLMPIPDQLLGASGVCGLWIKHQTEPVDLILHMESTSVYHRQRIILHELVHLWRDDADGVTDSEMDDLLADLPAAMVERLIGRGKVAARRRYETHKEIRTESAAALIHEQISQTEFIEDITVRRLAEDFTFPLGRPVHALGKRRV